MSKTVSFAPPRASSTQSAAKATAPASASPRKSSGRAASGSPSSLSLSLSFEDEIVPAPPAKPAKAVKAAPTKAAPVKAASAKAAASSPAPKKASVKKPVVKVDPSKPPVELKGKRVRVPKDLAEQYGGKIEERPNLPLPLEAESPKKRLTKEQREARKQLMKPDEELLARLARVAQVPIVKAKSEPRGKGWKFVCGRCGTTSFFQVPAALCSCGAIALKD